MSKINLHKMLGGIIVQIKDQNLSAILRQICDSIDKLNIEIETVKIHLSEKEE